MRGEGCHDPRALRADLAAFFRSLRTELGGQPLPYVWVPEWHKTGHGLHAHFAVNRFIKRSVIEHAWGRGFVHIKILGDLKVGSGPLAEARSAAGYLSKYVSKTFDEPEFHSLGLHRYDVAQGFQPGPIHLSGASSEGVLDQASDYLGSLPKRSWSELGRSTGDLGPMGSMNVDPSQPLSAVQAWVRSTCAAQDIPERISDPAVLGEVATLLLPGRRGRNTTPAIARTLRAGRLLTRVWHESVRVESMAPGPDSRKDRHVVKHRLDDGDLAGEVQLLPLSA